MSIEELFILAIFLLLLESIVPSLGLLGLGGFVAFSCGLFIMFESGLNSFYGLSIESVAAFGFSIFAIFAFCGYFVFKSFGKKIETGVEHMIGATAQVSSWDKNHGNVMFEGEAWRAESNEQTSLSQGDIVKITGYKDLTLIIEKEE